MHVSTALDAIEKLGHFKAYAISHELYVEQHNLAKQAKAALAELDKATSKGAGASKKSSKKAKEGTAMADTPDPKMRAICQQDLEKRSHRERQGQGGIRRKGDVLVLRKLSVCGC